LLADSPLDDTKRDNIAFSAYAFEHMTRRHIVIADDQLLIRAGIAALIGSLQEYVIDAACADGTEALTAIRRAQPDIALLDIAMPGLSGIEVTRAIRELDGDMKILILSSIDRREIVDQALQAGADGYLLKDFILDDLQQALAAVVDGKGFLSPSLAGTAALQAPGAGELGRNPRLTARQIEILRLVASGKTSKEIARDLGISPKTVEFHRAGLMERLGVHDVTALTRYAIQAGVVS